MITTSGKAATMLVEPHVKRWYDDLAEGRFTGKRCNRCGAVEFPPVPVCNECSSTDLEFIEVDGTGTMVSFSVMRFLDPIQAPYGPRIIAQVDLPGGTSFTAPLVGYDIDRSDDLYELLPAPVTMTTIERDRYTFVGFELADR
ncbi:MAG: zinc ribbon domain-containing protein [Actinomycetota bacterium]|nr:zinc ribbon domain-containing protein [Actinomycetota bacterium]